jgi:mannose/cellobiose epimerase-like protein (N-acyl-D-glucosamine 2-epimerase family)
VTSSVYPAAKRLRDWAVRQSLPLWADVGFDREHGRFEERLTLQARPVTGAPQRLMVQARQIYSFSLAARRGWYPDDRFLVEQAYRSMVRDFFRRDDRDGWIFSVRRDGTIDDATRDLYAHAFVLLGTASYVEAGGSRTALGVADETLEFVDSHLSAPEGGYIDALPRPDDLRRQNPHMHLLEGLLALWSVSRERKYLARAEGIFELFASRFFGPPGVLGEYFDDRLAPAPGIDGQLVEPGHHYEWIWLLHRLSRESGRNVQSYTDALYRHADRYGYDGDSLVMDEVRRDGQPHKRSRRIWPMTEAIKANLAEAAAGREEAAEKAAGLTHRLCDRFLNGVTSGGWMDRLDGQGGAATDVMPASTLYHILCALDELDRFASG